MSLQEDFNKIKEAAERLQKLVNEDPMKIGGTKEEFEASRKLENPCTRCEEDEAVYFDDENAYCNHCMEYLEVLGESLEEERNI